MPELLILTTSYLLGSIPFGYLLVRIFHGEDVRLSGSGNIAQISGTRRANAPARRDQRDMRGARCRSSIHACMARQCGCQPLSLAVNRGALRRSRTHVSGVAAVSWRQGRGHFRRRIRASGSSRNSRSVCYLRGRGPCFKIRFAGIGRCRTQPAGIRLVLVAAWHWSGTLFASAHRDRFGSGDREASRKHSPTVGRLRKPFRIEIQVKKRT